MTSRTACHHLFATDLVIDLQLISLRRVDIAILPLHVIDLFLRPDEFFRSAVASNTPFHLERILLEYRRHIVYLSVTGRAADTLGDVNAVIEICVFGEVVDAFPFDGLVFAEACSNWFEILLIREQLAVAVHTGLRRRHTGRRGRLDRLMTITAIDTVITDVVLVRKLQRLLFLYELTRQIRRPRKLRERKTAKPGQHDAGNDAYPSDVVCTFVEELCHRSHSTGPGHITGRSI